MWTKGWWIRSNQVSQRTCKDAREMYLLVPPLPLERGSFKMCWTSTWPDDFHITWLSVMSPFQGLGATSERILFAQQSHFHYLHLTVLTNPRPSLSILNLLTPVLRNFTKWPNFFFFSLLRTHMNHFNVEVYILYSEN